MAVPPTSPASDRCKVEEDKTKKEREPSQNKRSKNPGVRVQGGRIYDPELGKTCHQCRQKTMDFAASCKVVEGNKPCTIQFCHKCLLNRYGENAEEVSNLDDWRCPKCRGVCNCSFCMRKKGHKPTGILVHTAKHTGFSSVHEMLSNGGLKTENVPKDASSSPNNVPVHKKGPVSSKRGRDKGNCNFVQDGLSQIEIDGFKKSVLAKRHEKPLKKLKLSSHAGIESNHNNVSQVKGKLGTPAKVVLAEAENNKENLNGNTKDKNIVKVPKFRRLPPKLDYEPIKEEIIRSPGKPLTVVAGVELPHEDVGPALQFLEFCNVFSKVLDIKKGEPEAIIRELARSCTMRRHCRVNSAIFQFQSRLLSFIVEDLGEELSHGTKGENSWLKALGKLLNDSRHPFRELPLDFNNFSQYNNLDSSKKLNILIFLCDEALGTGVIRKFIDEENAKFAEEKRERNEEIIAAKKKEKLIKQTLRNDLAKALLSSNSEAQLSIHDHTDLVLKLKNETERAHKEMLKSIDLLPKKKQVPDAVRTRPIFLEKEGLVYWKLKSYKSSSSIILQDVDKWDLAIPQDKWFSFDNEEEAAVERYISSLSSKRQVNFYCALGVKRAKLEKHRLKSVDSTRVKDDFFGNTISELLYGRHYPLGG